MKRVKEFAIFLTIELDWECLGEAEHPTGYKNCLKFIKDGVEIYVVPTVHEKKCVAIWRHYNFIALVNTETKKLVKPYNEDEDLDQSVEDFLSSLK